MTGRQAILAGLLAAALLLPAGGCKFIEELGRTSSPSSSAASSDEPVGGVPEKAERYRPPANEVIPFAKPVDFGPSGLDLSDYEKEQLRATGADGELELRRRRSSFEKEEKARSKWVFGL